MLKNINLNILLSITILIVVLLSINSFYTADDYGFITNFKQTGIVKGCYDGYLAWDGRFLSIGAFFQAFCLLYLPVEIIILIWTLCLLASGVLIFYILNEEFQFQITNNKKKILIATLTISLWLGAHSHVAETVYWATGGVYVFDLFLGAIWTYLFLRLQRFETSTINKFLFVIFSILVGGLTQNLSMPLLTLTAITLLSNYLKKENRNALFNSILFFALLSGLVFIMVAPGNFLRLKADSTSDFAHLNVFILIKNFFYVLAKFILRSAVAIIVSIILGVAIAWQVNPKTKLKLPNFKSIKNSTFQGWGAKWFFVAVSSVLPFIAIPMFSAKRTVIYFGYFISIFVIGFVLKLFQGDELCTENQVDKNRNKSKLLFFIVIFASFVFALYNLQKGYILKAAITKREIILKSNRGKTVHLKLINPNLNSPCFQFQDYSVKNDFIKSSQEAYFGVKIIVDK